MHVFKGWRRRRSSTVAGFRTRQVGELCQRRRGPTCVRVLILIVSVIVRQGQVGDVHNLSVKIHVSTIEPSTILEALGGPMLWNHDGSMSDYRGTIMGSSLNRPGSTMEEPRFYLISRGIPSDHHLCPLFGGFHVFG